MWFGTVQETLPIEVITISGPGPEEFVGEQPGGPLQYSCLSFFSSAPSRDKQKDRPSNRLVNGQNL